MRISAGLASAALMVLSGSAIAHHSFAMFDQEHPEQLGKTRMTLFEIHPILHIEVDNNGTWQSIDG